MINLKFLILVKLIILFILLILFYRLLYINCIDNFNNFDYLNNKNDNVSDIITRHNNLSKNTEFDIIYSYTCHENKECFVDTLKNLFYFNKNQNICVVVNCNKYMFNNFKNIDNYPEFKNVIIYPYPWEKIKYTYDLLDAHLQNFSYCLYNNITSKYIILLASNCMFHKAITMNDINNYIISSENLDLSKYRKIKDDKDTWHWPALLKNKKLIKILNDNDCCINKIIGCQHEGMIIPYSVSKNILTFINSNNIKNNIENQTVFEEILLPTLYKKFTKNNPSHCCKVFWNNLNYRPEINEIIKCDKHCVKNVNRSIDDTVRIWLRNKNNNYSLQN